MDPEPLVESQINDGQKLIDKLQQEGVDVSAAFWLLPAESDQWRFYIVTPVADQEGPLGGYRAIHPVIRQMPQPFGIDLLTVRVIGPSDPIARDVLTILTRTAGIKGYNLRWRGSVLGDLAIQKSHLYPLPARAAS